MALTKQHTILIVAFAVCFILSVTVFIVLQRKVSKAFPTKYQFSETKPKNAFCQFPILNPFDPSIQKFISHHGPLMCDKTQPNVTTLFPNGTVYINLREYNGTIFECGYKPVELDLSPENQLDALVDFGDWTAFPAKTGLTFPSYNAIEVNCWNRTNQTQGLYYNVHAYPKEIDTTKLGKTSEHQLSVLLFVIDGLSNSMFKRSLPLLHAFVMNEMQCNVFEFFSKIGDNTFPNMMAVLTGFRGKTEQTDMKFETPSKDGPFDDFPLIWNDFQDKNYLTAFLEDWPEYSMFYYYAEGFRKPPRLHYNFRDYSLALQEYTECFADRPVMEQQLELVSRTFTIYKRIRKFFYYHSNDLSHGEDVGEIQLGDRMLLNFFNSSFRTGMFNDTVIFLMGDHGPRFGDFRAKTAAGLIEERAPFVSIIFPTWFFDKHPEIRQNLVTNKYRLAATFDIHSTLQDILNSNYNGSQRNSTERNLSLLYPLPLNRTCWEAGIPDHFCLCAQTEPYTNQERAKSASLFLVKALNLNLKKAYPGKCHTLKLSKILNVEKLVNNKHLLRNDVRNTKKLRKAEELAKNNSVELMRIKFEVHPSNAILECSVRFREETSKFEKVGAVSRLNKFKNQSWCIPDRILRMYCFCK